MVKTESLRSPFGEEDPELCLVIPILLAKTRDLLLVRDNKPGEHVQLAQSALLTLLLATRMKKCGDKKMDDGSAICYRLRKRRN